MDASEGSNRYYNFKYVEESQLNRIIASVKETRRNRIPDEGEAETTPPCKIDCIDVLPRSAGESVSSLLHGNTSKPLQSTASSSTYNYARIKDAPKSVMSNESQISLLSSQSGSGSHFTVENLWVADLDEANVSSEEMFIISKDEDEEVNSDKSAGAGKVTDVSITAPKNRYKIEQIKRFSKEILEDPVIAENFQKLLNVTYSNMEELGYDTDSFMETRKHIRIPTSTKPEEDTLVNDATGNEVPSHLSLDKVSTSTNEVNKQAIPNVRVYSAKAKVGKVVADAGVSKHNDASRKSSSGTSIQKDKITPGKDVTPALQRNVSDKKLSLKRTEGHHRIPLSKVPLECRNKLCVIHTKTSNLLECLRSQLGCTILEADGALEAERRRRRDDEFASRFGRNYLYELSRQMTDLPRLVAVKNKSLALIQQLCNRLLALHQIIVQGIQAYLKHLPDTLQKQIPERVISLLKRALDLTEISLMFDLSTSAPVLKRKLKQLLRQAKDEEPEPKPSSAAQKKTKVSVEAKDRYEMYRPGQRRKKHSTKTKAIDVEAAQSCETLNIVRDPDVTTAISQMKKEDLPAIPPNRAMLVRSAPNLPIEAKTTQRSPEAEKLLGAMKYKKKMIRLMKKNPLVPKNDPAWLMVSQVVSQLMEESIIDIVSKFTTCEIPDEDSEF